MRFQTCLIVWHSKEPVLSVDFHPTGRLATGGADNTVKIWRVRPSTSDDSVSVEFLSNLKRHTRAVNVVRFAPNGELLASGGDDGFIFLWKLEGEGQLRPSQTFGDEDDDSSLNKETWNIVATLRYLSYVLESKFSVLFRKRRRR
jgi:chromatin assembly factor 1 subunit B